MPMTSLTITREHRSWMDRAREYQILVDGEIAGTVRNDESIEVSLEEGEHTIQAKIDWCSSPEIRIDAGEEQLNLRCGANATPLSALSYILTNRDNYLWLARD